MANEALKNAIKQLTELFIKNDIDTILANSKSLVKNFPRSFVVHNMLGIANLKAGNLNASHAFFKKVTILNSKFAEGFNNLGVVLHQLKKFENSITEYKNAISLKVDYTEAYYNIGSAYNCLNQFDDAVQNFDKAVSLSPNHFKAQIGKALALQNSGKPQESLDYCVKIASLNPRNLAIFQHLAGFYRKSGNELEAIAAFKHILKLRPDYAAGYFNLAGLLYEYGYISESVENYNHALQYRPDHPETYLNLGLALQNLGEIENAQKAYQKAIYLRPEYALAYRHLSTITRFNKTDNYGEKIRNILSSGVLDEKGKCNLHYALAKISEDNEDYQEAFKHYVSGGALRKKILGYSFERDVQIFKKIKQISLQYKKITVEPQIKNEMTIPVFVLGMPRSGTTLVEQIFTQHSQVSSVGEFKVLSQISSELVLGNKKVTSDNLNEIRDIYLSKLNTNSEGKKYTIDKMPQNFLFIGLICRLFSEAKVIHVHRDARATCWSNFKHYFVSNGLGYSYDLNDVVGYYKMYQELISYWRQNFNASIYELNYDELTKNPEYEIGKAADFLELEWEGSFMDFHQSNKAIKTASRMQVKQKIYTGSSEKWHKFAPFIDDVFNTLTRPPTF
jgi:tetratricopeptide (TPR) repeat protein